jgi:hypothetical protein
MRLALVASGRRDWLRRGTGAVAALMTLALGGGLALAGPLSGSAAASGLGTITVNAPDWSADAGYGSTEPAWYTDNDGVVHLQGAAQLVSSGNGSDLLGTMSGGAPDRDVYTIAHSLGGTYVDIVINPAGQIYVIDPKPPMVTDDRFVSLEGINYYPGSHFVPPYVFAVNTNNWSGTARYGSVTPRVLVYSEPGGSPGASIVQLQGAVTLVNGSGDANLIGRVPSFALPDRDVYTIVHTLAGTYADLVINTIGEVRVIGPAWPLTVPGYGFVSLEGITYRRSASINDGVYPVVTKGYWSPYAGYASVSPRYCHCIDGVVHLMGAVAYEPLGSDPDPNLIAVLPPDAAPGRDVYVIAHALGGTYADLVINTLGEIRMIGARFPASTNRGFISLEGITYQQ